MVPVFTSILHFFYQFEPKNASAMAACREPGHRLVLTQAGTNKVAISTLHHDPANAMGVATDLSRCNTLAQVASFTGSQGRRAARQPSRCGAGWAALVREERPRCTWRGGGVLFTVRWSLVLHLRLLLQNEER
jgi:hypothetical protein